MFSGPARVYIFMAVAVVLMLGAGGLFVLSLTQSQLPSAVLAGAIMGMVAALTLLYKTILTRRNCQQLRAELLNMVDGNRITPVIGSGMLHELSQSLNIFTSYSQQQIEDARRRAKEAEIQLKVVALEREHAQSIIKSISDAVLVTDPWDELVMANESASKALSFKVPEEGRQPIDALVRDPKVVALIRDMRQSQSSGSRRVVEHKIRTAGGERTYKITLSCLGGNRPEGAGVVAVLHDMTHEAEVAQMKNDFVSHVSHELRTPLASIKAYVEMLIDGEATDPKQQTEFYEVIQNEANRLGRLIDNILDVSRIESGVVKVNKAPLSLTVIIKEAVEIITPQAKTKDITVTEASLPTMYLVQADKDMIHRVMLNLLSNAVKYTREGGTVHVSMEVDESNKKIRVKVSDSGVGIPPKDLPHVFDKFYRVEANSRMAKGTGLGLSLVKHIVETVHQGKVTIESTVGKGTTFCIELELAS